MRPTILTRILLAVIATIAFALSFAIFFL